MKKYIFFILSFIFLSSFVSADLRDGVYYSFDESNVTSNNLLDQGDLKINASCIMDSNCDTVIGKIINASDFDGTNDYILFPSSLNPIIKDDYTLTSWVNLDSHTSTGTIFSDWSVKLNMKIDIRPTGKVRVNNGNGDSSFDSVLESITTLSNNQWYHISVTRDCTTNNLSIYINGVLDNSKITTYCGGILSTNDLYSGISGLTFDQLNGKLDEMGIWNRSLIQTEISELYNNGTGFNPYTVAPVTSEFDYIENTAFVSQSTPVTLTGIGWQTIIDSDFNVSVNNTAIYGAYNLEVTATANNVLECRFSIDGDIKGTFQRNNVADVTGNKFVMSEFFSLENGTANPHNQLFECRRISGGGQIDIDKTIGIGHFMQNEFGQEIPHNSSSFSSVVNSGASYTLVDSFNYTVSNLTQGDLIKAIVIESAINYYNNDGGAQELNSYFSIGGTNCSFYPRDVSAGGVGSVSHDCVLENVTTSQTYEINYYGLGTNANYTGNSIIKEFILSPEEISGSQDLVGTNFTGDTETVLFNFTGQNVNHAVNNVFEKVSYSIETDEDTTVYMRLEIVNGVTLSSVNWTRDFSAGEIGVLVGHDILENLDVDSVQVILYANCGSPTATCNIVGGSRSGYITDSTTTILNEYTVSVFDNHDNSVINNFSVTLTSGAVFSTTTGSVDIAESINPDNLTITSSFNGGYFTHNVIDHNTTQDLNISLNQTYVSWDCVEKVSGSDLNCTAPLESDVFNYNVIGNQHIQSVNVTGYYENIELFNVTALQNNTLTSLFYSTQLTVDSSSPVGATEVCTYNITGITYPSFNEELTGNNSVVFNLINGTYNIFADCEGFAYGSENVTIENTTQTLTMVLYTTNSINFEFRNEITKALINTETISIELISDLFSSNYTTTSGTLYADLLSPNLYQMRFIGSTNYTSERFYAFDLANRSTSNLTLYLLESNSAENITITLYDQYNKFIEDAFISVLKYDLETNTYITREIIKTNFGGQANFIGELNTEFYKFLVEFPKGTVIKETSPSYLLTDSLIIKVILGETSGVNFDNYQTLSYNLNYTESSNNFRYTYSETTGILEQTCLKVYEQKLTGNTLLNTTCSTSASGTILIGVTPDNGTTYLAKAFATFDGEEQFIDSHTKTFDADQPFKNDKSGIIYAIIITFIIMLMFSWNMALMIAMTPFGLVLSSLLGILVVPLGIIIGIQILAVVIAIVINQRA